MAGGIVGVEPLDLPGGKAYRMKMADGTLGNIVHGQPGEELAKRFAPSESAMGPNATADASDVAGTVGKGLLYSNPITAGGALAYDAAKGAYNALTAPSAPPAPTGRQGTTTVEAPQAQPAAQPETVPASATAAPAAPAASQSGLVGHAMSGVNPATGKVVQGIAVQKEDGTIGIYVPPVAGRPGGLTQLGKQEIEQTTKADKEAARQNALAEISRQRGVDAALDDNAEKEGYVIEQQKQNIMAAQQQQDEVAKQTAAVDKLQAGYQAVRDDFMNSKVDPDQYLRGNKARGIFSALGVMLNQFGSAFTHQPNVAAEFVNSQIDRNIRAQENQINVKGKAADNMLADLTRQTGDLKLAKLSMKQILTERAGLEAQRIGMGAKNQAVKANADEVAARLAAQTVEQDKDKGIAFTEHVMSSPLTYQRGSAGSSGGFIPVTQDSYEHAAANERAEEELRLKAAKDAAVTGKIPGLKGTSNTSYDAAQTVQIAGKNIQDKYKEAGVDFNKDVPLVNTHLYGWAVKNPSKAQQLKVDLKIMAKEGVRALTGTAPDVETLRHIDDMSLNQLMRENKNHLQNSGEKLEMLKHKAKEGIQSPDDNGSTE